MALSDLLNLNSKKPAQPDLPDTLIIDGRVVPVRFRFNARARRIIMRMERDSTGIVLTVPPNTSEQAAYDFAHLQSAWIWQRLASETQPKSIPDLEGSPVLIRGVEHRLCIEGGRGVPVHIRDFPEAQLVVRGDKAHMQRRVTDFLKREARSDLETASAQYARAMDVTFKRLSVRDTTTRWGSCSTTGTLSYSWRLIMAPPKVLDYVCAHEVAHILEMNHGPDFWALVYKHCPHTDFGRKWLRQNGHTLHKLPI